MQHLPEYTSKVDEKLLSWGYRTFRFFKFVNSAKNKSCKAEMDGETVKNTNVRKLQSSALQTHTPQTSLIEC